MSKQQQEAIRKSSTVRLQANLLKCGVYDESVEAINRQHLIAAWALANGMDNPPVEGAGAGAVKRTFGYDPLVEREKLQRERENFLMEIQMREKELDEVRKNEEEKMKFEAAMKEKYQKKMIQLKGEKLKLEYDRMRMQTRGQSNLTKSASRGPIPRLGVTPGG